MKEGEKTAQQPVQDQIFQFQMRCFYRNGFLGEINLLLKCKVNPAHTQSSMGYQEGKFGSWAYELPGAKTSDVFFI